QQLLGGGHRPGPPRGAQVGRALDVLAAEPAGAAHGGSVSAAVRQCLSAVARNWGLVLLLLAVNVLLAGALAVPLAADMEKELRNKDAAPGMMYGFDYNWW